MLNESTLVLEGVTLAGVVKLVVKVLVDLAGGTVLHQKTAKDTEAAHPEDLAVWGVSTNLDQVYQIGPRAGRLVGIVVERLGSCPSDIPKVISNSEPIDGNGVDEPRHTGLSGTLALTEATVATDAASQVQLTGTGPRVHGHGLADDEAIGDELADGLARVGVGDLVDLVGVEPDLALTAADDRRGKALLSSQIDPVKTLDISNLSLVMGEKKYCRPAVELIDAVVGFCRPRVSRASIDPK